MKPFSGWEGLHLVGMEEREGSKLVAPGGCHLSGRIPWKFKVTHLEQQRVEVLLRPGLGRRRAELRSTRTAQGAGTDQQELMFPRSWAERGWGRRDQTLLLLAKENNLRA